MNKITDVQEPFDGIKDQGQPPPFYFNLLFYGLIVFAALFMSYYLLSGWSSAGEFQQKWAAHQKLVTRSVTQARQAGK